MLYPKREMKFTPEDFKNPGSEYRATPFWAWNNKLDSKELVWQIEQLKKLGYGGFHMHVRTGMATEYLSEEYMEIVKACVEKAREEKMLAWLYDEDRWPSGAAGGIVTKDPKYRIKHLLLTRKPYGTSVEIVPEKRSRASSARCDNGVLVACFEILLNNNGNLEFYKRISENDAITDDALANDGSGSRFKLYAYEETALPNPWFNNQTYANTLDPESIREFIKVTYGIYERYFKKDFGSVIPAIFTDEPQFSQKGTLNFAQEDKDVTLPWTSDIEETYKAAYGGESLLGGLPELLWDLKGGMVSKIRYHYHDHIAERFASAFADQCGQWCKEKGIMLTGHMMEEPTLESQTHALGEAMRSFRSFQLPGIDMLCDRRELTTAKQAQSAARQMGVPGTLSELYGVTNWYFDFRGHKLQGDWQAALGVTVRVPHLSWVSMNGEAKRDYPSTFNYQSPWYKEYPYVEDHFARLASVLTRGKAVCRVGVIHPIESYWLHWGARENTAAIREEMDRKFLNLCDWLLKGLIDFDYICESTLPLYCKTSDIPASSGISGSGNECSFPVGEMKYDVIIVPALKTIRQSTMERLEAFRNAGGRLIFLGDPPSHMDADINDSGRKLWERSERLGFERLPILDALEEIRDLDIRDSSGSNTKTLLHQLREEEDIRWLFIAQAENPQNPDLPKGDIIKIQLRGEWAATLYDTLSGEIYPIPVTHKNGWTVISRSFYEHDSLLIKLDKGVPLQETGESRLGTSAVSMDGRSTLAVNPSFIRFDKPVPISLEEPNVLLLDIAEYALEKNSPLGESPKQPESGLEWKEKEEILRIDNLLRSELSWPTRGDAWAQPWVENDTSTPHVLHLRFLIESKTAVSGAELSLENANAKITLNGIEAGGITGWYVDKCIVKHSLSEIKAGTNVLVVSFPYGKKVDVEAMYLLGDFGVNVCGTNSLITEPVRTLTFGDICNQGLPFYGGNIVYHLEADLKTKPENNLHILRATNYRGHLLKVKLNGRDLGPLVYSPYEMELNPDALQAPAASSVNAANAGSAAPVSNPGRQKIDLIYFGSRINTFGQLHCVERNPGFWWGPNSWRTTGANWSYEYKFWPQGILKSPEIF